MSSDYFMEQTLRNMAPILAKQNRFELIATLTGILWIFAGLFSDPYLYIVSLVFTIGISVTLTIYSFMEEDYVYDYHVAAFRRLILGAIAHWAYTTGKSQGPDELVFGDLSIPVLLISQYTLVGLLVIWFASKYFDYFNDPNVPSTVYPIVVIRGIFRGFFLTVLVYAILNLGGKGVPIPESWETPLLVAYIAEPFVYALAQQMNPTMSRTEMVLGNARLPSVALRESFLSNTFILIFTMMFNGVIGPIWQLLRVLYIIGTILIFIYSLDAIDKFSANPLGKNAIGQFFNNTPDKLQDLDLTTAIGYVIDDETLLDLSKKASLNIEPGSVIVPLEETKGRVNALVLGKGQSILQTGKERIGEHIEGASSLLIPEKEFKKLSQKYIGTQLTNINLEELGLPDLPQIQQYVGLLAQNMGAFVDRIQNQLTKIDLSKYGIVDDGDHTSVTLPGIDVKETSDLTTVRVGSIRVIDGLKASTVRIGSSVTIVDLPKASFVSLPGINILDVDGVGSALNILGFTISDGLPVEKIDEFRALVMSQLDRWEMGLDAELGRYLADSSATGLLNVGWDGEFKMLLDSKNKTLGNHQALQLAAGKSPDMLYLPPNFDEQMNKRSESDIKFIELTGVDPTPAEKSTDTLKQPSIAQLKEKENTESEVKQKERKVKIDPDAVIYDVEIDEIEEEE